MPQSLQKLMLTLHAIHKSHELPVSIEIDRATAYVPAWVHVHVGIRHKQQNSAATCIQQKMTGMTNAFVLS